MAGKLLAPSKIKRGKGSRHDDEGERDMGEQHAVVKSAQPTLPAIGLSFAGHCSDR